jgi:hypothetical protein
MLPDTAAQMYINDERNEYLSGEWDPIILDIVYSRSEHTGVSGVPDAGSYFWPNVSASGQPSVWDNPSYVAGESAGNVVNQVKEATGLSGAVLAVFGGLLLLALLKR